MKKNNKFLFKSKLKPSGDQPKAIDELSKNILKGKKHQTLLGATGTGKTFTMANVIAKTGKTTLIMAHNKTLAAQLYAELKEYFPNNRVEYFISYFDYYQPEAYKPAQDMYIEKQSVRNAEIEMMRMSTIDALLKQNDVIVVASVAAIYGARDPKEWEQFIEHLKIGKQLDRKKLLEKLIRMEYKRNDYDITPGSFMVKGDTIFISPSWTNEYFLRIELFGDEIESISEVDITTKKVLRNIKDVLLSPGTASVISINKVKTAIERIKIDLDKRLKYFKKENMLLEAERLEQRTKFDIEQLQETGTCSGIENYSIYFEPERKSGDPSYSLFDYLPKDFLLFIDESHISLPQIRGMYEGDKSRKTTLVEYGFRLPTALDNRPLKFNEFENKVNQVVYVSATPSEYEILKSDKKVVEQIIRPTGLLDPTIEIKKTNNQLDDLMEEIYKRKKRNERVFVNTITKKLAEQISSYFSEKGIKVSYLHSDLKTFEREEVIRKLRIGIFDAVVGINLLREGLDVPEVSLMAILDADKDGYLRNKTSLIQIIGRVARNENGHVIMYADKTTQSMKDAISETERRRKMQIEYNKKNKIVPKTIIKSIPKAMMKEIENSTYIKLPKKQLIEKIKDLEKQMFDASKNYDFETAIKLRDLIIELKENS